VLPHQNRVQNSQHQLLVYAVVSCKIETKQIFNKKRKNNLKLRNNFAVFHFCNQLLNFQNCNRDLNERTCEEAENVWRWSGAAVVGEADF